MAAYAWERVFPAHEIGGVSEIFRYDADRALIVFGGEVDSGYARKTYTFDGSDWTLAKGPPPASGALGFRAFGATYAGAAYDRVRGRLVSFGGVSLGTDPQPPYDNAETRLWDGTDWTYPSPAHAPTTRRDTALGWHPGTNKVVLFGGFRITDDNLSADYLTDTWTWDGSDWTQETPAHVPDPAGDYAIVLGDHTTSTRLETLGSDLVLIRGRVGGVSDHFETWTWDGSDWTESSPAHAPSARSEFAAAYHPGFGKVVLFGGRHGDFSTRLGDLWTWDGSDWTEERMIPVEGGGAGAKWGAMMESDEDNGELYLHGGTIFTADVGVLETHRLVVVPAARGVYFDRTVAPEIGSSAGAGSGAVQLRGISFAAGDSGGAAGAGDGGVSLAGVRVKLG